MKTVAVIGAGITGLTAAFELKEQGVPVVVYESSDRSGGVIQTVRKDGFIAETGPNTIMETSPRIKEMVSNLGLEAARFYSDPAAKNRYILRNGEPEALPSSQIEFVKTRLFSWSAKMRLGQEVFIRRAPENVEEDLASFVVRRLGKEFLDYAINPFVAGIYAGDPARLSVRHAFPKLHALEQRYGSLLLGQLLGAKERSQRKEVSKQNAPKFSFCDGLDKIVGALESRLSSEVRLRSEVQAIRETVDGWRVTVRTPSGLREEEHGAVLITCPAHRFAKLGLEAHLALGLEALGEIRYAPVTTLSLGFKRSQVAHPLDGFGILIPEREHRSILGAIFASSLFPNRAPKDHVLITCYLGGLRDPEMARRDSGSQVAVALRDLRATLGVIGTPAFIHRAVFPQAIPQYEVGFGRFKDLMTQAEGKAPGLFLAGNYRDGISLSDSILGGFSAADRVQKFLSSRTNESELLKAA